MGVTVSKSEDKDNVRTSKAIKDFRRVSKGVGKLGIMARDARLKNEALNGTKIDHGVKPPAEKPQSDSRKSSLNEPPELLRRPSVPHYYDGTDRGHTLVYKDTTDAWAALREGLVLDNIEEIPDTEISVVDSTLGGYKTVEKTRGAAGTQHGSDTDPVSGKDSYHNRGEVSLEEQNFVIPFADGTEPDGWKEKIEPQSKCALCNAFTGHDTYPCRICNQVFHEDCLRRRGKVNDSEGLKALRSANTNIGWSCPECENIGRLLSDDEMFELMEVFERCDVDSDATISVEEFIEYRQLVVKDHEDRNLTEDEIEEERRHFKAMDTDHTGSLSWWEFLNHETIRRLATRSKVSLVMMLQPKEIQRLRTNFATFDTDGDGCVTEFEARRAFKNWFSKFMEDPAHMSPSAQRRIGSQASLKMSTEFASHVNTNAGMLMDADKDRSGCVSWEEYLMEQALYTLAVRPNIGPVKINKRPSFCTF
ncbi:PHD finger protein 24-like [Diadema setosum]|uniref:PHD finger protein 24-like n=1 Tax=Diadema setosum TaxID=31175 RepID=UPI003B3BDD97